VTRFLYAARQVHCPEHAVVVEHVPWNEGKRPMGASLFLDILRPSPIPPKDFQVPICKSLIINTGDLALSPPVVKGD
jgi:hypothetical protein